MLKNFFNNVANVCTCQPSASHEDDIEVLKEGYANLAYDATNQDWVNGNSLTEIYRRSFPIITLAVYNKSSTLSDDDVKLIIEAQRKELPAFLTAWNLDSTVVLKFVSEGEEPHLPDDHNDNTYPQGTWPIIFQDELEEVDGAYAYHTAHLGSSVPYALIGTHDSEKDKQYGIDEISSSFSHEVYEMLFSPLIRCYWLIDDSSWDAEVVDPVQSLPVMVTVGTKQVALANYVLPRWLDREALRENGKFDRSGVLNFPLSVANGGYQIVNYVGESEQIDGPYAHDEEEEEEEEDANAKQSRKRKSKNKRNLSKRQKEILQRKIQGSPDDEEDEEQMIDSQGRKLQKRKASLRIDRKKHVKRGYGKSSTGLGKH